MKSIRIQLGNEAHRAFKMYAADKETTMQDIVQDFIHDLLKQNGWSGEDVKDDSD